MRAAVLGHPIEHSLSPALHLSAYAALGLTDWTYSAVDMTPDRLPAFVAALDESWAGLSLTMPLKQAVLPLLSSTSPLAAALGVVNTVTFDAGRALVGDNTDVEGIVVALRSAGVRSVSSACVLGGGATAASAVAALGDLGCGTPRVVVRSVARAGAVVGAARALGVAPVLQGWGADVDLSGEVVISTVPAGAADGLALRLAAGPRPRSLGTLLDVVYAPWPTALARAWSAGGGAVVAGFEMLLHQAAGQFRLMTGLEPPVEAMRAGALAELERRAAAGR